MALRSRLQMVQHHIESFPCFPFPHAAFKSYNPEHRLQCLCPECRDHLAWDCWTRTVYRNPPGLFVETEEVPCRLRDDRYCTRHQSNCVASLVKALESIRQLEIDGVRATCSVTSAFVGATNSSGQLIDLCTIATNARYCGCFARRPRGYRRSLFYGGRTVLLVQDAHLLRPSNRGPPTCAYGNASNLLVRAQDSRLHTRCTE